MTLGEFLSKVCIAYTCGHLWFVEGISGPVACVAAIILIILSFRRDEQLARMNIGRWFPTLGSLWIVGLVVGFGMFGGLNSLLNSPLLSTSEIILSVSLGACVASFTVIGFEEIVNWFYGYRPR